MSAYYRGSMEKYLAEFRLLGIDIKVHWSFVLVLAYGALVFGTGSAGWLVGGIYGAIAFLLLFVCVTLHELGHALTAGRYGIATRSILLLPIGGVANLERIPEKPVEELVITCAGPLVNFAIAVLLFPLVLLSGEKVLGLGGWTILGDGGDTPGVASLIRFLFWSNLGLGLFNLLPAFPMDGGRMLRSFLAMTMSYTRATRAAVFVGRLIAVAFAIYGILGPGAIGLLLIAFFVYVGGSAELESVSSRAVLKNVRARRALSPGAVSLYSSERIDRAMDLVMTSYQTDYPVLDLAGSFVGVLTRPRLVYALRELGADARIVDIMLPAEQIPVCQPDTDLAAVWETMARTGSRVVAVEEDRRFLGLITHDDIAEVFQVMGAALEGKRRHTPTGTQSSSHGDQGNA